MNANFTVERIPLGPDRVTLRPAGELDLASAGCLEQWVSEAIEAGFGVLLDLREITFVDSTGLTAILSAAAGTARAGLPFALVDPIPPQPRRLMELTGVLPLLPLTPAGELAEPA